MRCAVIANGHKCVLNPYYRPVCGNDMKTYPNKDILDCFNRQRPRIRRKYLFVTLLSVLAKRDMSPFSLPLTLTVNS